MNDPAIRVENLGKLYRIGSKERYNTFRETLVHAAKAPFLRVQDAWRKGFYSQPQAPSSSHAEGISPLSAPSSMLSPGDDHIWALKDVSFEVKRGEVVGIIGRNGAGKSTLLKILARITEPTEGRIRLRGRLGSLLEVGTGFHSELTGEENIYLSGTILGMNSNEISRKFDEIVAFAGIERFIHTPVKYYSSGMYMRLAFAVAAHLDTEILLIDEVLAVGDAEFQKKCLGKMEHFAQGGRTVLFVSHNMAAVTSICQHGILLEEGKIAFSGPIHETYSYYMDRIAETARSGGDISHRKDRIGTGEVRLTNFFIENEVGEIVEAVRNGTTANLVFEYMTKDNKDIADVDFQIVVRTQSGDQLFQIGTRFTGEKFERIPPRGKFIFTIKKFPLVPGRYRLDTYIAVRGNPSDYILMLMHIDVVDGDYYHSGYLVLEKESKFLVDGSVSCQAL